MKRRDFLKSTAAISGGGLLTGTGALGAENEVADEQVPGPQPNILFILVDELRYPTVFPGKISSAGEFLAQYMPHVHSLWERGVKFGNYHTAANACTPSRGVLITGLYSQQNWLITTILSSPYPDPTPPQEPVLNSAYPTYGRLLRDAGYQTPYFGKWHVSNPSPDPDTLEPYGFDFQTYYDPTGENLQGTYGDESRMYHSDGYTANQAINWLKNRSVNDAPWCATVSFVNPHDREFFPAGTEYQTVDNVFANDNPGNRKSFAPGYGKSSGTGPVVPWDEDMLKSPSPYGYPVVPPNWEDADTLAKNKPSTHTLVRQFSAAFWGGATDDPTQDTATIVDYPNRYKHLDIGYGIAHMPFSYWQRGLDSYTQIMQIVDGQIGAVLGALENLPPKIKDNTVVVFVSDHGEYSGAHGIMQGKVATLYEEAWHIPLIVMDPSHRFTGDLNTVRDGLTSSVDLSTMLVSIGNRGTRDWMKGYLRLMYGGRHDMISMLKSASAPGRRYVLHATDEIVPDIVNFNRAPTHVLGIRTDEFKMGIYSDWIPLTSRIIPASIEKEFYDYSTPGGRLELDNTANDDSRTKLIYDLLVYEIIQRELQAPLPPPLRIEQEKSKIAHLIYRETLARKLASEWLEGHGLQNILGYGRMF